jgi:hypothetical protein
MEGIEMLDRLRSKRFVQIVLFILLFLIVSIFSLRFDPEIRDLESGVFSNYLTSIVEDGDLNIVNQVKDGGDWLVTTTYNHPTLHDHGISNLWLPFYLISKGIKTLGGDLSYFKREGYRSTMVLANVFFFLFLSILVFKFCNEVLKRKMSLFDFFIITFGTPLFWYGVIHPSSADLTSAIFPFFYFLCHHWCLSHKSKESWFFYGLILSCGLIVKVSLLFYFILPLHYLVVNKEKAFDEFVDKILPFLGGSLLVIIPYLINEYVKYGHFHYAYSGIVASYYLFFETVFGPSGYITVSPIYLLALISLVTLIKKRNSDTILYLFLLSAPVLKVLVESYTYAGNAEFGARHLITDLLVFVVFYPSFFIKDLKWSYIVRGISLLLALWCVYMSFAFMRDIEIGDYRWGMFYENSLGAVSSQWSKVTYFLSNVMKGFSFQNLIELSKYFPIFVLGGVILSEFNRYKISIKKNQIILVKSLASYLALTYLSITLLNLINNKSNVENMIFSQKFNKTVVVSGSEGYHFDDNVGNMLMRIKFLENRGNHSEIESTVSTLYEYADKVIEQVEVDPIDFKTSLKNRDFVQISY